METDWPTDRGFVWSNGSGIGLTLELLIAKEKFKKKKKSVRQSFKIKYHESTKIQQEIQELGLCSSI